MISSECGSWLLSGSKLNKSGISNLMASSNYSSKEGSNQVLVEEDLYGLKVTLNRPQKLNCLTYEMITQIFSTLKVHENNSKLKVVILKGKGRAFCAGGDIARVIQLSILGHWSFGAKYYNKQLILDHLLATYKKPLVSLINGIVMGGGAGLSMHGTFRIATENAIFAMPETSVGLVPDVGASHFLTRLPGFFGEYLGLTGARIDGSEMVACGLATHFVLSKDLLLLEKALCEVDSSHSTVISNIIKKFVHTPIIKPSSVHNRLDVINTCFSKDTVEEILSSLEYEVAKGDDKLLTVALSSMKKASPMSLKASLKSIREGRAQTIEQCLLRESTISCHMLRQTVSHDFFEGTRAMILDKDKNPKWEPCKLELVTEEMLDELFTEPDDDDDWEYFRLPLRSNQSKIAQPKL